MNLNKVFVLGNVTRDIEQRSLPSGQPVVSFGIATNRFFTVQGKGKQQETEFHNITLFGRLAEIASQYLKKGSLVLIEGRLRTRNWQDSAGAKHYKTEIIGEKMQLGPRATNDNSGNEFYKKGNFQTSNQDIPIIEEEPNFKEETARGKARENNNKGIPPEEKEEEIDIKDIPF